MKHLTVSDYQAKFNVVASEHEVLDYWDVAKTFERSVQERPENKRYVFYDGPPFATGLPHYGHILASTIKDVVPRYWTMQGYRVDRVWGWDCHGIPIENMIEKELGLKGGKKGIEAMGIGKFNAACKSAILRFDKDWEKIIRRIGRWVDFKHSYKTMDKTYMESVWWAFKSLYDKGLVYEGRKVILYCPRCATPLSNFEIAMDNSYKDMEGPSTTYKYKVKGEKNTYLLAWSTTPWNKLATPALAVNPSFEYVRVRQHNEEYILVKTRLVMLDSEPYEIVATMTGKELESLEFEPHYNFYPKKADERNGVVVADPYVTDSEGTGIVTLAVYGEDDYRVMTKHHIQKIEHVDAEGMLKPEVTPWAGMFMLKVNTLVNEDLAKRGLIYHDEQRLHSVPVCYRCETRLYHAPVPAWFIDVQKYKPELLEQNENINWYPEYLKHGRFGKGLETAPDWNISRSRYWGTPMPIWQNREHLRIIGSLEELQKWAVDADRVKNLTDIHREYLDDLEVWVDDAKTIKGKRIPEVFDCWVESGSMPYASIHYPFEHKKEFEATHPAQFIAEYIAQTRAWFYTLHVMSVGLFGKHTFENAVTTGTVLASDGSKMSKSKKNYPDPVLLIEKYGVDALRFYLMGSVVMRAENLNFSEDGVKEVYQKLISIVWNVFSFYKMYVKSPAPTVAPVPVHVLDRWIMSRLSGLVSETTQAMNSYDVVAACRHILAFVSDLSTWYLRRSRDRIQSDASTQQVFGWVLRSLVLVMAPITPFITERIYQNLVDQPDSVHLESWPKGDESLIDTTLEEEMTAARTVVESAHAKRKELAIKLRQPLASAEVSLPIELSQPVLDVIRDEINVLAITLKKGEAGVVFDTNLTEELKTLGLVRGLIRDVQVLRKEKGCRIDEQIELTLPEANKSLSEQLVEMVKKETLAAIITWGDQLSISTTKQTTQ